MLRSNWAPFPENKSTVNTRNIKRRTTYTRRSHLYCMLVGNSRPPPRSPPPPPLHPTMSPLRTINSSKRSTKNIVLPQGCSKPNHFPTTEAWHTNAREHRRQFRQDMRRAQRPCQQQGYRECNKRTAGVLSKLGKKQRRKVRAHEKGVALRINCLAPSLQPQTTADTQSLHPNTNSSRTPKGDRFRKPSIGYSTRTSRETIQPSGLPPRHQVSKAK